METTAPLTIILADDHGIIREGIAAQCKSRPEISILGQCSDGEQAVAMILSCKPDVAVLDLHMPKLGGLDLVRRVRQANCVTKLVILSISRDEILIRELFRSGADGYVLKDGPAHHLFDAINDVLDGRHYLTPLLRRDSVEAHGEKKDPLALLSKREHQVFSFLVDGMRPKDIAKILRISPKTVDTYRANIMRKLEVHGIAGLVRFALQQNLHAGPLTC